MTEETRKSPVTPSTWARMKTWVVGFFVVLGVAAAAVFTFWRKSKDEGAAEEREEIKEELEQTEIEAEKHLKEGRDADRKELEDIAADPDPDSRDKRTDKWLGEGVE